MIKTLYKHYHIILIIWLLLSYFEILSKQTTGAIYSNYNLITLFINLLVK